MRDAFAGQAAQLHQHVPLGVRAGVSGEALDESRPVARVWGTPGCPAKVTVNALPLGVGSSLTEERQPGQRETGGIDAGAGEHGSGSRSRSAGLLAAITSAPGAEQQPFATRS